MLTQASNVRASARTRPFVANEDRISELFPAEQRASVDQLIDLLVDPIGELVVQPARHREVRLDAEAVYHLAFGTLRGHLVRRTRPSHVETDHLVRFCLGGIGHTGEEG